MSCHQSTLMHDNQLASRCRAIHAACRELNLDEATRRDLIENVAGRGKRSTKDLTLETADNVLDLLKKRGASLGKTSKRAASKSTGQSRPHNFNVDPYYAKIEALLADMGLPWAYAQKIAENVTGGKKPEAVKRLEWLAPSPAAQTHFRAIVTALIKEKAKRVTNVRAVLNAKLIERGLTPKWCIDTAKAMGRFNTPWPWPDCLQTLDLLIKRLG